MISITEQQKKYGVQQSFLKLSGKLQVNIKLDFSNIPKISRASILKKKASLLKP